MSYHFIYFIQISFQLNHNGKKIRSIVTVNINTIYRDITDLISTNCDELLSYEKLLSSIFLNLSERFRHR